MTVRSYKPKGSTIKALQFNFENADEALQWVTGSRLVRSDDGSDVVLQFPTFDGIKTVEDGSWILLSRDRGFYVMSSEDFAERYEAVKATRSKDEG